jgi:hypothetical protein
MPAPGFYWAVEVTGVNPATSLPETFRFALGEGRAPTDAGYIRGDLAHWDSVSQRIGIGDPGSADPGELVIDNHPDDSVSTGAYDALVDYAWQGQTASLYKVPGTTWAGKVLWARARVEQPVAEIGQLRFPLRDPRADLEAPLQTTLYAGDNVPPDGVEGDANLKGKPKPVVYGTVSNLEPDLVNRARQIYQLADAAVTVMCVRDGGVPLPLSTVRGSLASMQATAPPQGSYDSYAGSEGTFIRLGATPVKTLTCDAQEGATEADRTHAQIWKRIRTERCATDPGDIDSASVTAVDALDGHEVGFRFTTETCRAAIDKLLASLVGYEVQQTDGSWTIGRFAAPSGTPAYNLVQALGVLDQKVGDRKLTALERSRPTWQATGAPPYRVDVRWGLNHTVMAADAFVGFAAPRLQQKFKDPWRVETAADPAIWDPATGGGAFPNAPMLIVDTGYQPGADTYTCPHAATRAGDLLTLLSAIAGQYTAGFVPQDGDALLPGTVVQVTHPRFGLSGGPTFLLLQARLTVEHEEDATVGVVLALETP